MWKGERVETTRTDRVAIEHLHRYAIGLNFVENKTVLDIASGEGYGTNLLSKKAKFVYGVDIDESVIKYSKNKYSNSNIKFLVGSTSAIPIADSSIDTVVSFETIEHHDEHDEMLSEIKRVLKPEGVLIISSPDKLYYSDERNYKNEFHVKELYKKDFLNLISGNFKNTQLLSQKHINGASLVLNEMNLSCLKLFSGTFNEIKPENPNAMFLIAIASDSTFENQEISVFDGSSIEEEYLNNSFDQIRNSLTFKVGLLFLSPFRFLKRVFKK